jgi:hypothetical protein
MAIKAALESKQQLNRPLARLAAIVSIVFTAGGAAAAIILPAINSDAPQWQGARGPLTVFAAVLCMMTVLGIQLIRGRVWAQRALLVFSLIVAAAAVMIVLGGVLWGQALGAKRLAWMAGAALVLLGAGASAWVLILASAPGSRLRYGSYVSLSVVTAIAVLAAVNMIAQKDYYRRDMETLGRFGLSDPARKIISAVSEPVKLTCVYTSTSERARGSDFRPRVLELLGEMSEANGNVDVFNATNDAEKARVVDRLRKKLGGSADEHVKFLEQFVTAAGDIVASSRNAQKQWADLPDDSYLALWGLTAEAARNLGARADKIQRISVRIGSELEGGGVPDYAALAEEVAGELKTAGAVLGNIDLLVLRIAAIPGAVDANRRDALANIVKSLKAASSMLIALNSTDSSDAPATPGEALKAFVAAADKAAAQLRRTGTSMNQLGGPDAEELLPNASCCRTTVMTQMGKIPVSVGQFCVIISREIEKHRNRAANVAKLANVEHQAEVAVGMRKPVGDIIQLIQQMGSTAQGAISRLEEADEASKRIFALAGENALFKDIASRLTPLIDQADGLPQLDSGSLSLDVTQDNIVIVETGGDGGKVEVVNFESVWPLKVRRPGPEQDDTAVKRTFNGDSAIASKILSMTQEPFATVLLAHIPIPQEMARFIRPTIGVGNLQLLRRRLVEANFDVKEWDLSEKMPPAGSPDRPGVLLILPPPLMPPMSQYGGMDTGGGFGPEHLARIREAIDSGTPAVFLAQWLPPQSPGGYSPPTSQPYKLGDYLREDWGIDVLTDYLVMPAISDETLPGKFKLNLARFQHFPLSTFADHPICEPLQAQRVLWSWLCPVVASNQIPEGVKVESLLGVPAGQETTWATNNVLKLSRQLSSEGSNISPDYDGGDIRAGFDVAVAATRIAGENTRPARIVVLGIGAGVVDGYLGSPVVKTDSRGANTMLDPPHANATLVANSIYWLTGHDQYITAGPINIKPVELITQTTMYVLWALCVFCIPAAILAGGGIVMFVRRR